MNVTMSFDVKSIHGGFKITGEVGNAEAELTPPVHIGEAYASTKGQVPARIKALTEKWIAFHPESTP